MKKKFYYRCKPKRLLREEGLPKSKLDIYNAAHYMEDMRVIQQLPTKDINTKLWIETRRYELQFGANKYEKQFAALLIDREIYFIHQAPFIIDSKIYFADFYLPSYNIVFEIDGISHIDGYSRSCDYKRDKAFLSIGIRTIRIKNEDAAKPTVIVKILKQYNVKYKSRLVKLEIPVENNKRQQQ